MKDFFEEIRVPFLCGTIGGVAGTIIARLILHL